MSVRLANIRDLEELLGWLRSQSEVNRFDEGILDYPTLNFLRAGEGEATCYLPYHSSLVLESIAVNPSASPLARVKGALEAAQAAERVAVESGIRELYFDPSSPEVEGIARKQLGYNEIRLLRKRVGR